MSATPSGSQPLRVSGLVKRYGDHTVLDDVSLTVDAGEVVCIVGPNGSGKTTLVECVEGIRSPDAGSVEILGRRYSPHERRPARLGVQLQEESLPARIAVGDAVALYETLAGTAIGQAGHVETSGRALRLDHDDLYDVIGLRPGLLQHLFGALFDARPTETPDVSPLDPDHLV